MIQRHEWKWITKPAILSAVGGFGAVFLAEGVLGADIGPALIKAGAALVVIPLVVASVVLSRKRAALQTPAGGEGLQGGTGAALADAQGDPSAPQG